jgi:hypothetical protein
MNFLLRALQPAHIKQFLNLLAKEKESITLWLNIRHSGGFGGSHALQLLEEHVERILVKQKAVICQEVKKGRNPNEILLSMLCTAAHNKAASYENQRYSHLTDVGEAMYLINEYATSELLKRGFINDKIKSVAKQALIDDLYEMGCHKLPKY